MCTRHVWSLKVEVTGEACGIVVIESYGLSWTLKRIQVSPLPPSFEDALMTLIAVQRRELRQLAFCAAVKGCWWGIGRKSAMRCRQEGALPLWASLPQTPPMELRYALKPRECKHHLECVI